MSQRGAQAATQPAARLVRNAPHARMEAVAEIADVSVRALRKQLRTLPLRGGCPATAAAVASKAATAAIKVKGLSHRACPPSALRLASESRTEAVVDAGTGTTGWTGRKDPARMPRFALVGLTSLDTTPLSGAVRSKRISEAARASPLSTLTAVLCDAWAPADVARNPSCPAHALVRLSAAKSRDVRAAVARHRDTPGWVLAALAATESYGPARTAVAANSATPVEALRLLAASGWPPEDKLAANPSSPPDVLKSLCDSDNLNVRAAVARHTACPTEVLSRLTGDESRSARAAAARNPNCRPEDLRRVVEDGDDDIQRAAAANPNCPEDIVVGFARSDDWNLRLKAASNTACPTEVLRLLAADDSYNVRESAAANPSMPAEELDRLAADASGVRAAVATNPSTGPEALTVVVAAALDMYLEHQQSGRRGWYGPSYKQQHWAHVKQAAADHPSCTPEIESMLARG